MSRVIPEVITHRLFVYKEAQSVAKKKIYYDDDFKTINKIKEKGLIMKIEENGNKGMNNNGGKE